MHLKLLETNDVKYLSKNVVVCKIEGEASLLTLECLKNFYNFYLF